MNAVEAALEELKKDQESQTVKEEDEMEDEQENSMEGEEDLQPKGCKRWCTKVQVGFPIDLDYVKKQTDAKCEHEQCKGCTGGGLTVPDCREKEVVVEPTEELEETVGDDDVPLCTEDPPQPVKVCKLKEGAAELTCTHVNTAWCTPPSRNPGHKYRSESSNMPLCCDTESDLADVTVVVTNGTGGKENTTDPNKPDQPDMDEVQKALDAIKEAFENGLAEKEEDLPAEPVPVCAKGHTFKVDSFMRKGQKVYVCRDQATGRFAKNVCCDPEAFKLLEDSDKAIELCATMEEKKYWKYCKPDIGTFEKARKKSKFKAQLKDMPKTFSCKRMYMCCDKRKDEECFGPVPNQAWCMKDKTGLDENRPANKACVPVKL